MAVKFEWSEAKRKSNLRKHGIDFRDVRKVFEGDTLTSEDDRFPYPERRFVTIGLLEGRVVIVIHTEMACTIRIISTRKATRNEQEAYFKHFAN